MSDEDDTPNAYSTLLALVDRYVAAVNELSAVYQDILDYYLNFLTPEERSNLPPDVQRILDGREIERRGVN